MYLITYFFTGSVAQILNTIAIPLSAPTLAHVLLVGISFYTFQALMYTYQQQKRLIDEHMVRFVADHENFNITSIVMFELMIPPIGDATLQTHSIFKKRNSSCNKGYACVNKKGTLIKAFEVYDASKYK